MESCKNVSKPNSKSVSGKKPCRARINGMKIKNNIKNQRNKELALGQNNRDWQNLSEMNQKKEKAQINKIRNKK